MANISEHDLLQVVNSKQVDATTNRDRIRRQNDFLEKRYNAEHYGTEQPGRSRFVSNDVKDTVESAHTSLVRMFLGAGPIIKFTASNPNDQKQVKESEEKTQLVDWIVRGQTNSYKTQSSFLTNVLKLKAGIQKYFYEETESTEDHEWEGLTPSEVDDQLLALGFSFGEITEIEIEGGEIETEVEIRSASNNKEGKIISHKENEDGTFDLKVRVKVKRQQIKIINIPSGAFLISTGADNVDEAELIGDESFKTRGELLSEGFSRDLVKSLPSATIDGMTYRSISEDTTGNVAKSDFSEWASQLVPIADLYVLVDYNNDGISERRHIQKSGDIIIHNEAFDHVPYGVASALIVPNNAIGEGWGEQVVDIADVNTAISRGFLDNIYSVNNTKKVVRVGRGGVNLDEVLSSKIGGVIQATGTTPLADLVQPIFTEFVGDKALLIKQHMDQMKSQRVGGQLASQGLSSDTLSKETATRFTGIEKLDNAKTEKIARNIVEVGYRKIYEGVAWLLAHNQMDEIEFNVLGKALKANPSNWKYDTNVSTEIGLGAGDNEKMVQSMSGAWLIHNQLKEQGSPLTDEKKAYNILSKMYKAIDIKDVSQFINDPEEPSELLRFENEQLNKLALEQQQNIEIITEQLRLSNQLAEAAKVEQQTAILKERNNNAISILKLDENKRQFNIKTNQDDEHHDEEIAVDLTKIQADSNNKLVKV